VSSGGALASSFLFWLLCLCLTFVSGSLCPQNESEMFSSVLFLGRTQEELVLVFCQISEITRKRSDSEFPLLGDL
jgi:hypothetical protein